MARRKVLATASEERVWALHCGGLAPSEIAAATTLDAEWVVGVVSRVWSEDAMERACEEAARWACS